MKSMRIFLLLFLIINKAGFGQLSGPDMKELEKKEDSMKVFALKIIQGRNSADRFFADSQFTKIFVRALKINNSFNFPFDSLLTISKLEPPDSSFRIFTWQLVVNDNVTRHHGTIQMNSIDGTLKLFPLIDKTDVIQNIDDTVGNNFGWVGAVYYRIIEKVAFGKNVYTLLGFDENNISSNKKIIEVLTFDNGMPVFGGSYFSFQDNSLMKQFRARYIMEYKKNAGPRLTYDPDQDMIIYEHLISETGEPQKKYTYIPDGDYEGLKWISGKWVHIEKVFTVKTPEGQEPVPRPILDPNGNIDESKLSTRMPENYSQNPGDSIPKVSTPKSPGSGQDDN